MFYLALAAIPAIVVLAMSDTIVKSQRAEYMAPPPLKTGIPPSPFKFRGFPEPKDEVSNVISGGPTSPGSLDVTFGPGGKRTIDFSSDESAGAVAVQADGKVVAAGRVVVGPSDSASSGDFAVFRYNADGSLDTSFGADGTVVTSFGSGADGADAVAIQSDGKIIAAGESRDAMGTPGAALVRYNPDGSLDQSFGTGGKVITTGYGGISEIAVQTDGKIVAALGGFSVARYNGNGSLDASFGTGGIAAIDFGNQFQHGLSAALQADGKIVVAGRTGACDEKYCSFAFGLARYNNDGSVDTSFDTDGKLATDFDGGNGTAHAVSVQSDGKIVAAGNSVDVGGWGPIVAARYNADGSLDPSFDGDGKVVTGGPLAFPTSVALQPDGKIVISGNQVIVIGINSDLLLVRLNSDGSLDPSFDGDGILTTDFGNGNDSASDVAIQPNGKIVAAGVSAVGTSDFALSRYNADGSLDAAFEGDGKVTTPFHEVSAVAHAVDLGTVLAGFANNGSNDDFAIASSNQWGGRERRMTPIGSSDDRINAVAGGVCGVLAAGYTYNGSNKDFALACYSGVEISTWWGAGGKITTDFGGNDEATAVAFRGGDYKIHVVGKTDVGGGGAALVLARYIFNGAPDSAFGSGGRVILPAIQNPKAIVIQPDQKIILGGNAPHTVSPFGDNFALVRFNPDGSLDTSFDGDGIVVTRFDHSSQINSVTLQQHGQIVAAGYTRNSAGTVSEFALARYNTNGSLDTSFDGDGKVTTSFSGRSEATTVKVQRNGRIVAVGSTQDAVMGRDFAIARYSPNGSLDTSFDTDGKQTTDFSGGDDEAFSAAIEPGGNIVVAGYASRDGRKDFAAARYIGDVPLRAIYDYDYDADGWADLSVFRPSTGEWYLNRSQLGVAGYTWGSATDKIVPADYDRDSKTDIAVYRPSEGRWYILNSRDGTVWTSLWGEATDIPVPFGSRVAIFRPSDGNWWINGTSWSPNTLNYQLGESGDHPVVGNFDGNGDPDIAVFRPSTGIWYIRNSWTGVVTGFQWGLSTDKVVPADYDGDGKTDVAVYRPSEGAWYILNSGGSPSHTAVQFGTANDIPVPADYDGDGRADIAIFRPSDGTWWINRSVAGLVVVQWGQNGDKPIPNAFGN